MISEAVSVFLKLVLQMVIWVFVLSIKIDNKLVFDHAHDFLVKNEIVATLQGQFGDLWDQVIRTAKTGVENAPKKDADLL
jgi:hypothetical protein